MSNSDQVTTEAIVTDHINLTVSHAFRNFLTFSPCLSTRPVNMILGLPSPGNFPWFKDGLRTTAGSFPRLLFFAGVPSTPWKDKNNNTKICSQFFIGKETGYILLFYGTSVILKNSSCSQKGKVIRQTKSQQWKGRQSFFNSFTTDSDSSTASFLCLPLRLPLLLPAVELSCESPTVSLNSVLSDNVTAYNIIIKGNHDLGISEKMFSLCKT